MRKCFSIFVFLLLLSNSVAFAQKLSLSEIYKVADGMNIEGSRMPRKYARENQIWTNLCVVLDRPFIDGVEWKDLTEKNPYPMKEASLLEYNEARVNYGYLAIMHYYIKQAHSLIKKQNLDDYINLNIHVYRGTTGPKHIALLKDLLLNAFKDIEIEKDIFLLKEEKVSISFSSGTMKKPLKQKDQLINADINLTFSLIVGLNLEDKPGSFLIPCSHTPFSIKKELKYDPNESYFVCNHLLESIDDIILNQPLWFLDRINQEFISINPKKTDQKTKPLHKKDFKIGKLLEIDGDFNPSEVPEMVEIINLQKK